MHFLPHRVYNTIFMFTGIIRAIGTVTHHTVRARGGRLVIAFPPHIARRVRTGSSISVNGVCLTVAKKESASVWFLVMPETVRKTTLKRLKKGDRVNLEPSLTVGEEVGGHFVYGHIDGEGEIVSQKEHDREVVLTIRPPKNLLPFIGIHGAIAIDGVSLTVARKSKINFTVCLVDFTLKHTIFKNSKVKDKVNIELDKICTPMFLRKLREKE